MPFTLKELYHVKIFYLFSDTPIYIQIEGKFKMSFERLKVAEELIICETLRPTKIKKPNFQRQILM